MSIDKMPPLNQGEKPAQYILLRDHLRGSREPIPAGTIGTLAVQKNVKGEPWSLPIRFEGFGTYYVSESCLEKVESDIEKQENTQ